MAAPETDTRGMPAYHTSAHDTSSATDGWRKGPALERHAEAAYTDLPSPPDSVVTARADMDNAAALVHDLDRAARQLLAEYQAAPGKAAAAAREAVARGEKPVSTTALAQEQDRLATEYRDAVAHRAAVEAHLCALVEKYHQAAEEAFPEWRDRLAAQLDESAAQARTALSKALFQAREAVDLAVAVEGMDRPLWNPQSDRPRVSALAGRELPPELAPDPTRGTGGTNYAPGVTDIRADMDATARLATQWLRVEGNAQLGQGPISEALTLRTSDMPERTTPARRFDPDTSRRQHVVNEFLKESGQLNGW